MPKRRTSLTDLAQQLGVSICRTMAYSTGDDVGVESALGEGVRFWVEIPVL